MRFDTEEAFFKATFNAAGTTPHYIAEACDLELRTEGDWQKTIRTEVVRLVRSAFNVHLRADAQMGPGDSLLAHRLDEATRELPDGWQVVIVAQRGEVRVDLYDPANARYDLGTARQDLSGRADDAIRAAVLADTKATESQGK